MKLMWIIDRFEGDFAIIENQRETFSVPRRVLPPDAIEGDCLEIAVVPAKTDERKETVKNLMHKVFKNKE